MRGFSGASKYVEMRMSRRLWCCIIVVLAIYLILQSRQLARKLQDANTMERDTISYLDNNRRIYQHPKCRPRTNIAFVKTHKTGSTTLMNIIQRFGYYRNLTFVLPRQGLVYLGPHRLTLNSWSVLPRLENRSFNILCNHVIYNRRTFRKFMPKDTVYISILRQPLRRFLSAFWYYTHVHPQDYLMKIKGDNKLKTFLQNPALFENGVQYTHNAMATDLGLSPVNFHHRTEILRYIFGIDKNFSLVLILELFDESLVLFKRKLCWSLKDILYVPKNERSDLDSRKDVHNTSLTPEEIESHRNWDAADFYFYNHFHARLLQKINGEGAGFFEEVVYFRKVRMTVSKFCQEGSDTDSTQNKINIPETEFNEAFAVNRQECELLLIRSEEKFTQILIHKQYPNLQEIIQSNS